MKLIIPMAGRGSRLRPHTLTIPKPLMPVAGKPIVQRLAEDLIRSCNEKVDEIAFIIGDFGPGVEKQLKDIAAELGAKGSVFTQGEPLGTAHAILCAKDCLTGKCMIAFADTLFQASFDIDPEADGIIWAKKVDDPSAFGVLKLDNDGFITDFVEKPTTFVSDLAIVGIYYIKDGDNLRAELQYLIDNDLKEKGEYQLTNALENMKQKGLKFKPGEIEEWLDCGNKDAVVHTNQRVLDINKGTNLVAENVTLNNAQIIPPCYVGENVVLENTIIGPYVSIGRNTLVKNCVIHNSVIQENSKIENVVLENSMLGNQVDCLGKIHELSIGDYSKFTI